MPPKDHFKNKCYKNWEEKREWLHSVRADLVLNRRTFGLAYVLKHYEISFRVYKEHTDSYKHDAHEPNMIIRKTTRRKPKRGGT